MPRLKTVQPTTGPAAAFMAALHGSGWHTLASFSDRSNTFELLLKAGKTLLVQVYPESQGNGFEVWRPFGDSTSVELTDAVDAYAGSRSEMKNSQN